MRAARAAPCAARRDPSARVYAPYVQHIYVLLSGVYPTVQGVGPLSCCTTAVGVLLLMTMLHADHDSDASDARCSAAVRASGSG